MIGLDTTAIIDIFKADEGIRKVLEEITEPFVVTEISYSELMFGINPTNFKHKDEEKFYDDLFNSVLTAKMSRESCKKASRLWWMLKQKEQNIEQFDCIIAGTFLANGIEKVITRNVKHFSIIPGIKIISY